MKPRGSNRAWVTFEGVGIGLQRDRIVKKLKFPARGCKARDDDTLEILHARAYQSKWTRDELAKYTGVRVEITAVRDGDERAVGHEVG